jgi:hypothetical protein
MHMRVDVPIDVIYFGDAEQQAFRPIKLLWKGESLRITSIGLHHRHRVGRTLLHTFTVDTDHLCFRLTFNSDTLETRVEEISDGLPD